MTITRSFLTLFTLAAVTLALTPAVTAQRDARGQPTTQPRQHTPPTNPRAGIRGNDDRALNKRGQSFRGVSGRTAAPPALPRVFVDEEAEGYTSTPTPPPPGAAAAPGAGAGRGRAIRRRAAPRGAAPAATPQARVIRLASGRVLRGRAIHEQGQWKIATDNGTQTVSDDAVSSAALERDVLSVAKHRRQRIDRDDPDARMSEVRWLRDQGLAHEAMKDLLDLGAHSTADVQQLVIAELMSCGARHRNELEVLLRAESRARQPERRAFGAYALDELFPAPD